MNSNWSIARKWVFIVWNLFLWWSEIWKILTIAPNEISDDNLKQWFWVIHKWVDIGIKSQIKRYGVILDLSQNFKAEGNGAIRYDVNLQVKHCSGEQHGKNQSYHSLLCRVRKNFSNFRFLVIGHIILSVLSLDNVLLMLVKLGVGLHLDWLVINAAGLILKDRKLAFAFRLGLTERVRWLVIALILLVVLARIDCGNRRLIVLVVDRELRVASFLVLQKIRSFVWLNVLLDSLNLFLLLHHINSTLMLKELDELILTLWVLPHCVKALVGLSPETANPDESNKADHTSDSRCSWADLGSPACTIKLVGLRGGVRLIIITLSNDTIPDPSDIR